MSGTAGKPIVCRAAVLWKANEPYVIEQVEVAVPKPGEVRIKVTSAGLCHSDLHMQEGCDPKYPFPIVLGHEGAGIVESVGEGVKSVAPGDYVIPVFESYCGDCAFCKSPKTNMCLKQPRNNLQIDGTSRITCKGNPLAQMATVSTFSEYTVTNEINVAKVSKKAPANRMCLAGCCIPTGYGAVMNTAKVPPGSTCAIWGLGGVGMAVVMGCRDSGASKIIGIDLNPKKFPLAKEFGCTDVLNPKDHTKSLPEILQGMTNGGPDFCFVSVGVIAAMEEAFDSCHPAWGETVVIGLSDLGAKMRAGIWELIFGRVLKGTYYGSYKARVSIPSIIDKIVNGQIQLEKLISHVLPLDKINEGFNMLKTGESLRAIIDFDLK